MHKENIINIEKTTFSMTLGIMLHNFGKSKNLDFPKFHITKIPLEHK